MKGSAEVGVDVLWGWASLDSKTWRVLLQIEWMFLGFSKSFLCILHNFMGVFPFCRRSYWEPGKTPLELKCDYAALTRVSSRPYFPVPAATHSLKMQSHANHIQKSSLRYVFSCSRFHKSNPRLSVLKVKTAPRIFSFRWSCSGLGKRLQCSLHFCVVLVQRCGSPDF